MARGDVGAGVREALTWYAAAAALVAVALWIGVAVIGPPAWFHSPYGGPAFLDGHVRLDAMWYIRVARDGYSYVPGEQSSVAFFPAFPLALRLVAVAVRDWFVAGMIASVVFGALAAALFDIWCRARLDRRATTLSLLLLLFYPFAYYLYGVVYSEGLFLAAILGAFLLLERERLWIAGLVGGVAACTRVVGVAVPIALVVLLCERRGGWRGLRARDAGLLTVLVLPALWLVWLRQEFGDPLVFVKAASVEGWQEGAGIDTFLKFELFRSLADEDLVYRATLLLQAVLAVGAFALVPAVKRRFGWGYTTLVLALLAVPFVSSNDFLGFGRYILPAFPLFAVGGDWLARHPAWSPRVLVPSGVVLFALAVLFGQGLWIA